MLGGFLRNGTCTRFIGRFSEKIKVGKIYLLVLLGQDHYHIILFQILDLKGSIKFV